MYHAHRNAAISAALKHKKYDAQHGTRFKPDSYVGTKHRKDVKDLRDAEELRRHNAETNKRNTVLRDWQSGRIRVVHATIAFGMSIDNHKCRLVYMAGPLYSATDFCQAAGRAGRDGHSPSDVVYFHSAAVTDRLIAHVRREPDDTQRRLRIGELLQGIFLVALESECAWAMIDGTSTPSCTTMSRPSCA